MHIKTVILSISLIFSSLLVFSQNDDAEISRLLAEKRIENQQQKISSGYCIQLYNGLNENSALTKQMTFSSLFPNIRTKLIYEQPEWKVQTEVFQTELEAYRLWLKVKEEFQGTFIFEIKKGSK